MNLTELDNFNLKDVVRFHNELNPAIFEGTNMKEKVRDQLLTIAHDFIAHLGINGLNVADITVSGSNAAYSYTPMSDLDLHIVVDMTKLNDDSIYRELFDAKKVLYNDSHDIKIDGIEVELYVQDSNQPVISLGEYSVLHDKWIKLPRKRRANLDQASTHMKFNKLSKIADIALKHRDGEKIKNVLRTLKKYRQAGLDKHGEFGPENLAYKGLRSQGIIKQLYQVLDTLHSEKLSLPESKWLNKPEMTVTQLASKHHVTRQQIESQLSKGIKVEMEHTTKYGVAKEIALDHLSEDPNYYTKLSKVELDEVLDTQSAFPLQWHEDNPEEIIATTKDSQGNDIKFRFEYNNQYDATIIEFGRGKWGGLGYNLNQGGEQFNIFATALEAIRDYLTRYDWKPKYIVFSAKEPSRVRLYQTFVTRYAPSLGYQQVPVNTIPDAMAHLLDPKDTPFLLQLKGATMKEASGYIPSYKEKNDPRWKTALTVDVTPNSIKDNAKRLGSKISRAGIPPLLRP
jgi:hypothetical protein